MSYTIEVLTPGRQVTHGATAHNQETMREAGVAIVRSLRDKAGAKETNPPWLTAEREMAEIIFAREVRVPSGQIIRVQVYTCPLHEEYEEDCANCFEEAVSGGVSSILENLPGVDAKRMPDPAPFVAVLEASYEGDRLFPITYRQGGNFHNWEMIPEDAAERVRELREAAEQTVRHWDEQIERARDREDPEAEHRALSRRGEAGRRLDQIENWDLPLRPEVTA